MRYTVEQYKKARNEVLSKLSQSNIDKENFLWNRENQLDVYLIIIIIKHSAKMERDR